MAVFRKPGAIACAAILAAGMGGGALAGEGGGSIYLQGTFNDFQAGVFGPSGLYLRNDLAYYDADVGARPLGGAVAASSDQKLWIDLVKLAWLTDRELFGARVGFAVTAPYVIDANVSGAVRGGAFGAFASGDISGIGDIFLTPMLNWSGGNHHFSLTPSLVVPVGRYSTNRVLNTGRNYWALDAAGAYTWFDPEGGHEFSMTAGVLFNAENPATDYRSGAEFHADFLLGQYFSPQFGIGLNGYLYQQIGGDSGTIAGGLIDPDDFKGHGFGLGPAAIFNFTVGERQYSIIAKALFDIDSDKRYEGDIYMLSGAFKF